MAIAYSAKTQQKVAAGNATNTFSHTITGSDNFLFVGVSNENGGAMTSVTYNGTSMTLVASQGTLHLYALANPSTGANNVVATRATTANDFHCWALSYTGAQSSSTVDASANGSTTGTSLTANITTVADNCWTILLTRFDNAGLAPGTGSTERTTADAYDAWGMFDSNGAKSPAGSYSMGATGGSSNITYIIASIAPASSGAVATPTRMLMGIGS